MVANIIGSVSLFSYEVDHWQAFRVTVFVNTYIDKFQENPKT